MNAKQILERAIALETNSDLPAEFRRILASERAELEARIGREDWTAAEKQVESILHTCKVWKVNLQKGKRTLMTLKEALYLARTGKSRNLTLAASCLSGCPIGGWPETEQAIREIGGYLPIRSEREFSADEWIAAAYEAHGDRYRSRIYREEREWEASRLEAAAARKLKAAMPFEAQVAAGTVTVRLDSDGMICAVGASHDASEIAAAVKARPEWLAAATTAREAVLAAREARDQARR